MILLALLGGLTGTVWGLMEARRSAESERLAKIDAQDAATAENAAKLDAQEKEKFAKAAADKERVAQMEEERQRKFAEAISRFVRDDFLALTSVDGQERFGGAGKEALNKNSTLQQLLDRAAEKLQARKDLDPLIEAESVLDHRRQLPRDRRRQERDRVHGARRTDPRATARPGPLRHTRRHEQSRRNICSGRSARPGPVAFRGDVQTPESHARPRTSFHAHDDE